MVEKLDSKNSQNFCKKNNALRTRKRVCLRVVSDYIWAIDKEQSQDGYWSSPFCVCLWVKTESMSINL